MMAAEAAAAATAAPQQPSPLPAGPSRSARPNRPQGTRAGVRDVRVQEPIVISDDEVDGDVSLEAEPSP